MARQTGLQRQSRYLALAQGVRKRWAGRGTMLVGGLPYTQEEILEELDALAGEFDKTRKAHAAWRTQVARQRKHERARRDFVRLLSKSVEAEFGHDASALGDFGMRKPKKTGPKTVETKARSAEKARATRERRGAATGPKKRRR